VGSPVLGVVAAGTATARPTTVAAGPTAGSAAALVGPVVPLVVAAEQPAECADRVADGARAARSAGVVVLPTAVVAVVSVGPFAAAATAVPAVLVSTALVGAALVSAATVLAEDVAHRSEDVVDRAGRLVPFARGSVPARPVRLRAGVAAAARAAAARLLLASAVARPAERIAHRAQGVTDRTARPSIARRLLPARRTARTALRTTCVAATRCLAARTAITRTLILATKRISHRAQRVTDRPARPSIARRFLPTRRTPRSALLTTGVPATRCLTTRTVIPRALLLTGRTAVLATKGITHRTQGVTDWSTGPSVARRLPVPGRTLVPLIRLRTTGALAPEHLTHGPGGVTDRPTIAWGLPIPGVLAATAAISRALLLALRAGRVAGGSTRSVTYRTRLLATGRPARTIACRPPIARRLLFSGRTAGRRIPLLTAGTTQRLAEGPEGITDRPALRLAAVGPRAVLRCVGPHIRFVLVGTRLRVVAVVRGLVARAAGDRRRPVGRVLPLRILPLVAGDDVGKVGKAALLLGLVAVRLVLRVVALLVAFLVLVGSVGVAVGVAIIVVVVVVAVGAVVVRLVAVGAPVLDDVEYALADLGRLLLVIGKRGADGVVDAALEVLQLVAFRLPLAHPQVALLVERGELGHLLGTAPRLVRHVRERRLDGLQVALGALEFGAGAVEGAVGVDLGPERGLPPLEHGLALLKVLDLGRGGRAPFRRQAGPHLLGPCDRLELGVE
jgi:hypothetical protein